MPKSTKPKSLNIQTKENITHLDEVLSNGCATTVVILVGWCGACKRVKPMWLEALKKKNKKNLVLINNELLPETSLNSLDISHFPSTFEIPPGGTPSLVENPQTMKEINAILNGTAPTSELSGRANSDEVNASEYVTMHLTPRNRTMSMNSSQMNSSQMNSSQMNSSQMNSSQMNSSQMNSSQMNSSQPLQDSRVQRFTPSLEKLKGGRRRNKTKSKSNRSKLTRRR